VSIRRQKGGHTPTLRQAETKGGDWSCMASDRREALSGGKTGKANRGIAKMTQGGGGDSGEFLGKEDTNDG